MFTTTKGKITSDVPLDTATIIGSQTTLRGGVICAVQDLRIDGEVEADVRVEGRLVVGKDAEVKGAVIADEVIVLGLIRGAVASRGSLVLKSSSVVYGRVEAPSLTIQDGASGEFSVRIAKPERPEADTYPIMPDAIPSFRGDGASESTAVNLGVSFALTQQERASTFRPSNDSVPAIASEARASDAMASQASNGTASPETIRTSLPRETVAAAPLSHGSASPASNGAVSPVSNGSTSPAPNGAASPASNGTASPESNGSPSSATNGTPASAMDGSASPSSNGTAGHGSNGAEEHTSNAVTYDESAYNERAYEETPAEVAKGADDEDVFTTGRFW